MEELKACPFCSKGKGAAFKDNYDKFGVYCDACGAFIGVELECGTELVDGWKATYDTAEQAIAAWNARHDNWISVEERLPEVEKTVLIMQAFSETAPYANITIGHLHQNSDLRRKPYWSWIAQGADMVHPKIESYHRAEFICPGNEFVTHWQPLPEPPKGE